MWGITPFDQLWCRIKFHEHRYEGMYTPPGTDVSIYYSGYVGGMTWGGASVDPERQMPMVNRSLMPNVLQLNRREEAGRMGVVPMDIYKKKPGVSSAQAGALYAAATRPLLSPPQTPCLAPPCQLLTAALPTYADLQVVAEQVAPLNTGLRRTDAKIGRVCGTFASLAPSQAHRRCSA